MESDFASPAGPVNLEQVISLLQNGEEAPSVFGDDDALLSVVSDSARVKRPSTAMTASTTRSSADSRTLMMKPSELRSKDNPPLMLNDKWGTRDSTKSDVQLKLDSGQLIGRDKEIAALKDCFQSLMTSGETSSASASANDDAKKELVLISGESGTGKSSIVQTLEEDVVSCHRGIFVTGKFAMTSGDEPYSGISDALDKAFQKVEDTRMDSISSAIRDALVEDELQLLSHLIPSLKDMLGESSTTTTTAPAELDFDELENGLERSKYGFRVLTRVLCQEVSPIVLVLDDVHWADITSLQVMDSLISDRENENKLMIIGTYRSDEIDENSILFNKIVTLQGKRKDYKFNITEMTVQPLDAEDIDQLITTATASQTDEQTQNLAEVCRKKTSGNPFFVIEFLKMLHTEGLLMYDASLQKWVWDLSIIEESTMSTANVVMLLQQRMRSMPRHLQMLLEYAAYLGSNFKERTLALVWETHGRMMSFGTNEPLPKLLETLIQENFFERSMDGSTTRWVHDKLQEAALYFRGDVSASIQFDIGTTLYYCLKPEELKADLFIVVDLINNGNRKRLPDFVGVNIRAAEKARSISAFESAKNYAFQGLDLLTEKRWSEDRLLTLRLYILVVEMEMILGNVEIAEKYREEILEHGNFSIMETLPLKLSKAKSLSEVALEFEMAVDYGLAVLKELGCKLVLSKSLVPAQALVKVLRTVSKVKKLDVNFLTTIGTMSDPKRKAITSILSYVKYAAYNSGDMYLSMTCTCKIVHMTLKYGVSEFSGCAFGTLGSVVVFIHQDYEAALRVFDIASSVQKSCGNARTSEYLYSVLAFGLAWIKPIGGQEIGLGMSDTYTQGMRNGEIDYATWGLVSTVVFLPYATGKPLGPILAECPSLLLQLEELARTGPILTTKVFFQTMLNLCNGSKQNGLKLEGEIYNKVDDDNQSRIQVSTVLLMEGDLLVFMGDYEAAAERAITNRDMYAKHAPSLYFIMSETFGRGVALFAMARKTKKRPYEKEANMIRKQVAKWLKAGNPNVEHFHWLLQAEYEALGKKLDNADESYRKSIAVATTGNYLQYIALFHERYSDFLLNVRFCEGEAAHHSREAARYFEEWGALARAREIRDGLAGA